MNKINLEKSVYIAEKRVLSLSLGASNLSSQLQGKQQAKNIKRGTLGLVESKPKENDIPATKTREHFKTEEVGSGFDAAKRLNKFRKEVASGLGK